MAIYHQVAVEENNIRTLRLGQSGVIKGHKVLLEWVNLARTLIKKESSSFFCIVAKGKCRLWSDILEDTFFCLLLKEKSSKDW